MGVFFVFIILPLFLVQKRKLKDVESIWGDEESFGARKAWWVFWEQKFTDGLVRSLGNTKGRSGCRMSWLVAFWNYSVSPYNPMKDIVVLIPFKCCCVKSCPAIATTWTTRGPHRFLRNDSGHPQSHHLVAVHHSWCVKLQNCVAAASQNHQLLIYFDRTKFVCNHSLGSLYSLMLGPSACVCLRRFVMGPWVKLEETVVSCWRVQSFYQVI